MLRSRRFLTLFAAAATGFAADAGRQSDAQEATAASVARQTQAVTAMGAALASQRLSVQKQVGQDSSGSFFLLGPPSRTAGNPGGFLETGCDPLPGSEIEALIAGAARREDLQPALLRGIVHQESGFRPCAVSPKGAMGLMQLMPDTASQLGVRNPFDPKENVEAGAKLFKQLLTLYGDLPMALGAYNAGPSRVNEANGVPNIPETQSYVQKILSALPPKL
jgi:soluble lytic murein transglycosylase-like protein